MIRMRCPQCGTQNEPDSRFCGGCGARASGAENRLAPTEKIQSDAPMHVQPLGSISPSAGVAASRRVSAPPEMPTTPTPLPAARQDFSALPASIPPNNNGQWGAATPSYNGGGAPTPGIAPQNSGGAGRHQGPGPSTSIPQNNGTGPATSIPPQNVPAGSNRSAKRPTSSAVDGGTTAGSGAAGRRGSSDASIRPSRTRWGLIIFLLLFDAGLATAGTWMLLEGLADPPEVSSTKSGAIEPAPAAVRVADVTDASPTPPATTNTTGATEPPKPPVETKPVETKPVETKPAETTPVAITPGETTPGETKPTEQPVEQKPLDTAPLDAKKPLDTKPVTEKPVEQKPVVDKPVDTKPPTEKPVEQKPTKKPDDKKPNKKKPRKDDGRTGPEDPYGDPLPPETK